MVMPMNPNHLRAFHAVAAAGSFAKGAAAMGVSQPAVSMQVASLERALKLKLLHRRPRGTEPTEAGRTLLAFTRQLVALEAGAERAVKEVAGLERGRLRIAASTTVGNYLLPPVLADFHRAHPALDVRLTVANTREVERLLLDGAADVGLTEGSAPAGALASQIFRQDRLVPVAAPSHPAAGRTWTLKQLSAEPMVVREAGSGTREVFDRALSSRGLTQAILMTIGGSEAIKQLVAGGVGVAVLSRLAIAAEVATGSLAELDVAGLNLRRPLHRLLRENTPPDPAAAAFLTLLGRA